MKVERHAWVRLLCMGSRIDRDGTLWVDASGAWEQIPYLEPLDCQHACTVCSQCWRSWEYDHQVREVDPRLHGGTVNCRVLYPDVLVALPEGRDREEAVDMVVAELHALHGPEAVREFLGATEGVEAYNDVLNEIVRFVYTND